MIYELFKLLNEHKQHSLYMIIIGLIIRYIIGARKFNRRGLGGLQHFSSYGLGLLITAAEYIANIIGLLLILAGIFYLFIAN